MHRNKSRTPGFMNKKWICAVLVLITFVLQFTFMSGGMSSANILVNDISMMFAPPVKWGTVSWANGTGSYMVLQEVELGRILKSIPVSPEDAVSCTNLLDCTLQFLERLDKIPRHIAGTLVVATGDGRSYAISYPFLHFGPAHGHLVNNIQNAAVKTSKPTIFVISSIDGDIFCEQRQCKNPLEDTYRLAADFKLMYSLSSSSRYQPGEGGRIIPNSIPIPDPVTMHGGASGGACANSTFLSAEEISARPAKAVFYGSTTGYGSPYGPFTFSDRFRTADQMLDSNISEVHFINLIQGVNLPSDYVQPGVDAHHWKTKGRYFIDIDGNTNAWSALNWKLCSGGPVIKVNSSIGYVQWYYHLLEHGVHVHLVDASRQDVEEEIRRVINDIPYATKLAKNAKEFCCKYLKGEGQMRYLRRMISTIRDGPEYKDRDWRIKSPPADHLRPMASPYIRPGPMRRIQKALAVGGTSVDGGNSTIPTALLNVAKVIDIRVVCVFGSVFPPHMNQSFWNSRINQRIQYSPTLNPTNCTYCEMVVILEDLQSTVTTEEIRRVLSHDYHVIVSLGMTGSVVANATSRGKSEVVISTWPSVGGVVTQIPSILLHPDHPVLCPTRV